MNLKKIRSMSFFPAMITLAIALCFIWLVIFIWIGTSFDNFSNKNVGKEQIGKYFVYQKNYSEKLYRLLRDPQKDDYEIEDLLNDGEVIQVVDAKYNDYFESTRVTFVINLPCSNTKSAELYISGLYYQEGESIFDTSLREVDQSEIDKYCRQSQL